MREPVTTISASSVVSLEAVSLAPVVCACGSGAGAATALVTPPAAQVSANATAAETSERRRAMDWKAVPGAKAPAARAGWSCMLGFPPRVWKAHTDGRGLDHTILAGGL